MEETGFKLFVAVDRQGDVVDKEFYEDQQGESSIEQEQYDRMKPGHYPSMTKLGVTPARQRAETPNFLATVRSSVTLHPAATNFPK